MSAMLEIRGISKRYGWVSANRNISLTVRPGQILGLLGENGSGKTTLMKVLFGMVRPDAGTIQFKGEPLRDHNPRDAMAAGIGMIHQHFMLVDAMSVAENVMLGWLRAGRWLRKRTVKELIRETSSKYGLDLDPDAMVGELSFGRRQRVEIMKAILRGADLLILDEPTSNLSPPEVKSLLSVIRSLRQEGRSVIFISHKLSEIVEVCDDVVVLRLGEVVGECSVDRATREQLAAMMLGHEFPASQERATRSVSQEVLRVEGLSLQTRSGGERLRGIDFTLHEGEILAIAGVDGNGQGELVDVLAGLRAPTEGRIWLRDRDVTASDANARLAAGLSYIPVDRVNTSLVPAMTIQDNLALRDFDRSPLRRGPWLNRSGFRLQALERIKSFSIHCGGPSLPASTLSGGNQQKIVLARELGRKPKVLVALQPTFGLDPGATHFVLDQIMALRNAGGAILYVSAELEEVMFLGDRVGVMFNGRLFGITERQDADLEKIGLLMAGIEPPVELTYKHHGFEI